MADETAESAPEVRASVFIATSLDGFIAREDGGIDWLGADPTADEGEDYGFQAFFDTVDALVMGRNSWAIVESFPGWPYGDKRVVVLTTKGIDVREDLRDKVEQMSGTPREILARLGASGVRHVYVDGGKTVQGFLSEGLIQRMIITRIPVLIGSGIPLFGDLPHDVRLRHVRTQAYEAGLVQSEYEVAPSTQRPAPS